MKKEPLTHFLWAKICAYFLLGIFALGFMGSAVGIFAAWEMNVYTSDPYSLKDAAFRNLCVSAGDNIAIMVKYDSLSNADAQAALSNTEYRVSDNSGRVLWESLDYDAALNSPYSYSMVYRIEEQQNHTETGYIRSYEPGTKLEENEYLVEAAVNDSFPMYDMFYWMNKGIDILYSLRFAVYIIAFICLAGGVLCFIIILSGAGHRAGHDELCPGYLYKVPFDILTAGLTVLLVLGVVLLSELRYFPFGTAPSIIFAGGVIVAMLLLFTGWAASFAMRIKLGSWWKNTVIYRVLVLVGRFFRAIFRGAASLIRSLPLIWKTALGLVILSVIELIVLVVTHYELDNLLIIWFITRLVIFPAVVHLALTLRRLQKGGRALAAGELAYQTDTRHMLWDFKSHGENLNSIAAGMTKAVEEQLKSERLKTELITNVSHDLKTPLTSIINYVDLLKKEPEPQKYGEYLEVLDRQSKKLKKLTEDLLEVSKAATGNVDVKLCKNSVNELLRQALGEYDDRLRAANLEPVLTITGGEKFAYMDGALMWRVLDNLFSNVCKYGQSGTRFYIDVSGDEEDIRLTFKNVSRERLNLSAEELLERFVRGDASRSGEGSGLGLSIARSLTEIQGGKFSLSVDGDLFKAELIFKNAV